MARQTITTRSRATLDRIVEATHKVLSKNNYDGLSMRAVAAEAAVTPGAIYRHFPGKQALVEHVVHAALRDFERRLLEAIAPHPPGSFERIVAQGVAYIRLAMEQPEQFKVLFMYRAERTRAADLPGGGGFRILRRCVGEAMAAGTIRRGDPDLTAFYLWSRVHGIVTLLMACDLEDVLPVPKRDLKPLRLFELTRDLLWKGLQPHRKGKRR